MKYPDGWDAWVESLRTAEFTESESPVWIDPSDPDTPLPAPDGPTHRLRVHTQRRNQLPDPDGHDMWPGWYFRQAWRLMPATSEHTLAYIVYEQDEQGNARITGHIREQGGWTFVAQTRTFRDVFELVINELSERGMLT